MAVLRMTEFKNQASSDGRMSLAHVIWLTAMPQAFKMMKSGIGPNELAGGIAMRCKPELSSAVLAMFGGLAVATALHAQEPPGAAWRGAGAPPCFGRDG